MSCYNGCYSTPTISCSPYPSSCTGCLEYISTDCVQYLGTSYAIGFGILQGDTLTTMITKIYAETASANTWVTMNLTASSAYSTFTPMVTMNTKGEVKFMGIIYASSSSSAAKTITTSYISSPMYYPATTKGFVQSHGGEDYLIQFLAASGTITVTNLTGTTSWSARLDLSQIWYDKNI
jgi:hypothetical protein